MGFDSASYVPFGSALNGVPHIMVDSSSVEATALELSHWPGNRTPPAYKADTSAEIVLRFLEHGGDGPGVVSNDHYDVDGLLSVWSLVEPERALERRDHVVDVATTGDFDRYTSDAAVRACLALLALEVADVRGARSSEEVTAQLFTSMLPEVVACLDHPQRLEARYRTELRQIDRARDALAGGRVQVEEIDALDLAIVISDEDLHDYAVYAATDRTRILRMFGPVFSLAYRYESFVEVQSRVVPPRVDLAGLTARLDAEEVYGTGTWHADLVSNAHPRLQRYGHEVVGAPSAMAPSRFVDLVTAWLDRAEVSWSPERWREDASVRPPSMSKGAV